MGDSYQDKMQSEASLLDAITDRKYDEMQALLWKEGVDPDLPNLTGKGEFGALHFAVERNDLRAAKMCLDAGADLNLQDEYGNRPIDLAAALVVENQDMVDLLLLEERRRQKAKATSSTNPDDTIPTEDSITEPFNMASVATLDDLRRCDKFGKTGFIKLAYEGRFEEAIAKAQAVTGDQICLNDLVDVSDHNQMNVMTILGFDGRLEELFDKRLWRGRRQDCLELWRETPEQFKKQIDFKAIWHELCIYDAQMSGGHKAPRRRPKQSPHQPK